MSLLAGKELHDLIDAGVIDALHDNVNASSIDVRLGTEFLFERREVAFAVVAQKSNEFFVREHIPVGESLVIPPNAFFLGCTQEIFNLPDTISAEFKLRSSVARDGLNHALAGWADAGFNDAQLTLEFKSWRQYQALQIEVGMRIGQVIFYRHEAAGNNSYAVKGRYNSQRGVQASKGVR